jgi:O-antigen ligase
VSGPALVVLLLPAVLLVALLAGAFRRPLLAMLPFLVALNGLAIDIGVNVHVDQLLAALLAAGLALAVAMRRRRLYVDAVSLCILALLCLNVLSSALNSPVPGYSFQQVLNAGSVFAVYVVITNDLDTIGAVNDFFATSVVAGILCATFGIAMFVLGLAGVTTWGANIGSVDPGAAYGAYGTLVEPNVYGSYCQLYFIAALGILLLDPPGLGLRLRRRLQVLALTAGLGLFLSFTRGAWLGAICGLIALVVLARRGLHRSLPIRRAVVPLVGAGLALTAVAFSPSSAGEFFRYKAANLLNAQSATATVRLVTFVVAVAQVAQRPILGWGTYSFAPMTAGGGDFKELIGHGLWIPNFLLLALHDTGIVGLGVVIALVVAVIVLGRRAVARLRESRLDVAVTETALLAAFIGVLVTSQFASGFSLGYWWLFAGLVGAYARVSRTDRSARS